jgi:formimidoylglutamate deiminase
MLWAPRAWLDGRWAQSVLLSIDGDGRWGDIRAGADAPPAATRLPGPILPGLVDAHSHAFQRAFAGMAERRLGYDDFWSWRDRMYAVANRMTTGQLRAVAAQLYAELLAGGYTQVCEFHYLHNEPDGQPCADPSAMSQALVDAAGEAGIGLTLLPVLYERAGFAATSLRPDQRRFAAGVETVLELRERACSLGSVQVSAGVAIHSLRAAFPASLRRLVEHLRDEALPIHVHVAEQVAEVEDCLAATGLRPIEWLAREGLLDHHWQLVHATHASPEEIEAVARSGAGVVLCPTTEASLGDGIPDLPRWLAAAVPLSIGSDSQVTRSAVQELRLLEYSQRLSLRRRNVASDPAAYEGSSAARLFDLALAGGARAAGLQQWGFVPGARADLLVVDARLAGVSGAPASHVLDALVYAADAPAFREVWVAGRRVVTDGRHVADAAIAEAFTSAMHGIWPG